MRPRALEELEEPWNFETNFLDTKTRALLRYLKRSDLDTHTRLKIQEALKELSHKGGNKFERIIRQQSFPYENGVVVLADGTINRYVAREESAQETPQIEEEAKHIETTKEKAVEVSQEETQEEETQQEMKETPEKIVEGSLQTEVKIGETPEVDEAFPNEEESQETEETPEEEMSGKESSETPEMTVKENPEMSVEKSSEIEVTPEKEMTLEESPEGTLKVDMTESSEIEETVKETEMIVDRSKDTEQKIEEIEQEDASQYLPLLTLPLLPYLMEHVSPEYLLKNTEDNSKEIVKQEEEFEVQEEKVGEETNPEEMIVDGSTEQKAKHDMQDSSSYLPYLTLPVLPFLLEHVSPEHLQKNTEDNNNSKTMHEREGSHTPQEVAGVVQDDVMITSENEDSQHYDSDSENWEYIMSDDSE